MEITPGDIPAKALYKLMTGTIVPRPIGWVSSINHAGQPNLAPFSYFNAVCHNPPHVLFCPGVRAADDKAKDTLYNVRATGEFVINIVTEALAEAMNITATELPAGVNEFELADLTTAPALTVRPPRIAASPVHYECRVVHIYEIGDWPGAGSVVIGEVLHLHVNDEIVMDDYKIDIARLKPVGRLAGPNYTRITEQFSLIRPPSQVTRTST